MRAFLAFELTEAVRVELDRLVADTRAILREATPEPPRVSWVPSANLHVTLHFLGEVESAQLSGTYADLESACATSVRIRAAVCCQQHRIANLRFQGQMIGMKKKCLAGAPPHHYCRYSLLHGSASRIKFFALIQQLRYGVF